MFIFVLFFVHSEKDVVDQGGIECARKSDEQNGSVVWGFKTIYFKTVMYLTTFNITPFRSQYKYRKSRATSFRCTWVRMKTLKFLFGCGTL